MTSCYLSSGKDNRTSTHRILHVMQIKFHLLSLLLTLILWGGCTPKIGNQLLSEITASNSDSAIIQTDRALFVFHIGEKDTWRWYQNTTSTGHAEYGWWAEFGLDEKNYTCGYRLFKHPFAKPTSGTFNELIDAGQLNLSSRNMASKKKTGSGKTSIGLLSIPEDKASISSIIHSNKLIIVLEEQDLVDQFRKLTPDSILFHKQTGVRSFDRRQVAVSYQN